MKFKEITVSDIDELAKMYMDTFNAPPWNDSWTVETASKRLWQMIHCAGFYGIVAYDDTALLGMILGSEEQFYDGVMFNIKEFCVKIDMRNQGIGSRIFAEFESRLRSKGIGEIVLFTSRTDGTAGFYQKRGLEPYNSMVMMGKKL